MGLDMYLTAEVYLGHYDYMKDEAKRSTEYEKAQAVLDITGLTKMQEPNNGVYVKATAIYWRKANAIHRWFVENVQGGVDDCGTYYVERTKLEELRRVCAEVIAKSTTEPGLIKNGERFGPDTGWVAMIEEGEVIANPEVADELLPTTDGFFFGSTAYNEWYLRDLMHTVLGIDRILGLVDDESNELRWLHFEYHSSW